eukprot:CAMPEP_0119270154 /NCGR_PEP_ID=MMETSP1329-20130426/7274_1 /TAXON_ID=114041 /ORGANISM="Genus nov. species nov., Strain RCC1024" /LENGTH=75 /DNA_ID=CAMNT_0007270163 /DNA_START=84 /DNA_END=307 /DNA_ORIENTATION=-
MAALGAEGPEYCAVKDYDDASCQLVWSPVAGADSYAVEMRAAGADEWTLLSAALKSTTVRKKNLDPADSYAVEMR